MLKNFEVKANYKDALCVFYLLMFADMKIRKTTAMIVIILFQATFAFAQGKSEEEEDTTSLYDKEAFEQELRDLLDMPDDQAQQELTPKTTLQQLDGMMQIMKTKFATYYNAENYRLNKKDTIFACTYGFEGAEKNEIIKDNSGYITFAATISTSNDLEVCGLVYDAWLERLKNELGSRYRAESSDDSYKTEFFPLYMNDPSRSIYLIVRPAGEIFEVLFMLRGSIELIDVKNRFDLWEDKPDHSSEWDE